MPLAPHPDARVGRLSLGQRRGSAGALGNDAGVANDVMDNGDDPGSSRAQPGSSLAPLSNT